MRSDLLQDLERRSNVGNQPKSLPEITCCRFMIHLSIYLLVKIYFAIKMVHRTLKNCYLPDKSGRMRMFHRYVDCFTL